MTSSWQQPFTGPEMDLAAGSVFASRWWAMTGYGWLSGAYGGQWEPGFENVAHCRATGGPLHLSPVRHRSPDATCECGFYAYWSTDAAMPFLSSGGELPVLGVIEGYGRCLIGEKGLRCEKARIRGVWLGANLPSYQIISSSDLSTMYMETRQVISGDVRGAARRVFESSGVPVYDTRAELFAAHPLTTDYLPKPQEPAIPEPLPSDS